ncbi:MAG: hypothetical protein ACK42Z_07235 [Candidatus Kapaibacteriota bacterium]
MKTLMILTFLFLNLSLFSNDTPKVFYLNEIVVVSEDSQIEKSTSITDYTISKGVLNYRLLLITY